MISGFKHTLWHFWIPTYIQKCFRFHKVIIWIWRLWHTTQPISCSFLNIYHFHTNYITNLSKRHPMISDIHYSVSNFEFRWFLVIKKWLKWTFLSYNFIVFYLVVKYYITIYLVRNVHFIFNFLLGINLRNLWIYVFIYQFIIFDWIDFFNKILPLFLVNRFWYSYTLVSCPQLINYQHGLLIILN